MKLQVMSDLHLEFRSPYKKALEELLHPDADVYILAGDIHINPMVSHVAQTISRITDPKPVLWVPGNHDYWYGDLLKFSKGVPKNIHIMDNKTFMYEGQRFVGSTLWYAPESGVRLQNDDFFIENMANQAVRMRDRKFLADTVQDGDIVITHLFPHHDSISFRFRVSPLNVFFYNPMEELIEKKNIKLWIHGHTHDSFDYEFKGTRILCNPYGYYGGEMNKDFVKDLIVEI